MSDRIPIKYGEFYNEPRQVELQFGGQWYFLRSEFDDVKDDYSDYYDVYLLPFHSEEELRARPMYWTQLTDEHYLGQVPISEVGLDETRRKSIDGQAFARWLALHKAMRGASGKN